MTALEEANAAPLAQSQSTAWSIIAAYAVLLLKVMSATGLFYVAWSDDDTALRIIASVYLVDTILVMITTATLAESALKEPPNNPPQPTH